MPIAQAAPTPMTFCMTSIPTTQAVKSSRATPPRAEHPRIGTQADSGEKGEHEPRLKRGVEGDADAGGVRTVMSSAVTRPPTTGSGIEYLLQNAMRSMSLPANHQHERRESQGCRDSELPIHG